MRVQSRWRGSRCWSIRALPRIGPVTSSPEAMISQKVAHFRWPRSGAAARRSRPMACRAWRCTGCFSVLACMVFASEFSFSDGIEAGLQLLVAPLAGIPAILLQETVVAARFSDAAVAQDQDQVGIDDGAQAVAGDDGAALGAAQAQFFQVLQDARFGARIDRRQGIIQEQQAVVGQQ